MVENLAIFGYDHHRQDYGNWQYSQRSCFVRNTDIELGARHLWKASAEPLDGDAEMDLRSSSRLRSRAKATSDVAD